MNWFRNLKRQAEIRKLKARRTKDAEIMADEIKFPQPESWSPVSLDWGCMVIQRPLPVIRGGCVTDMDVDDMCQTLIRECYRLMGYAKIPRILKKGHAQTARKTKARGNNVRSER